MNVHPYIIAEIASTHEGEYDFAIKLFHLAAATGADAVKFQMFDRDTLLSRFHHKFDAFGVIQIDPGHWREILTEAGGASVDVHVEVFDETSLELAEASGAVNGYKIPTSDIGNLDHLKRVAETGKQVYLAVGGAAMFEIETALEVLVCACAYPPILMLGFQSFPTKIEDLNFARITALHQRFGLPVGYADHSDASETELARIFPAMAMGAGACVIEKHITDERSRQGRDYYSSLNPDEFSGFVRLIHQISPALGAAEAELTEAEMTYRRLMKRQAVAVQEMSAGEPLDITLVAFKRTGIDGLSPRDIEKFVGKPLKTDKSADAPIVAEDFGS